MTETEFRALAAQGYNRIPLVLESFADVVVLLQQVLQVAESQTQVGVPVKEVRLGCVSAVGARRGQLDLRIAQGIGRTASVPLEVALHLNQPEGERRIDPFIPGGIVDRGSEIMPDAVPAGIGADGQRPLQLHAHLTQLRL